MAHWPRDSDVTWYTSAGVLVPNTANKPITFAAGTYYADLSGSEGTVSSLQLSWDALLAAVSTIESTNFPASEASTFAAATDLWFPEGGTVTILAGSASTNMQHLAAGGARRLRAKLVVTVQGTLRARSHHKA